jgi:DNA polymerase-4
LCPDGVFLRGRMDRYAEISRQVFEIFDDFTPLVEPLSIDEAFLDVTGCRRLFGSASRVGRTIKGRILDELGLVASVGVASNKFLAKLASDLEKPDGLVVITSEGAQARLAPLPVRKLWGVGRVFGGGKKRKRPDSRLDDDARSTETVEDGAAAPQGQHPATTPHARRDSAHHPRRAP